MSGYEALRESAAWLDLDSRGRFRVKGEDRARLLHAMSTNHIQQMKPGDVCYAFFLNSQGRILADAHIICLDDHFLVDTEPEVHDSLYGHIDKYIIADDVTLEDAREDTTCLAVEGPASQPFEGFAISSTGLPGRRMYVPREDREGVIAKLGVPGASTEEQRIVRLENSHPRYGEDITERYLVQETQLLHAVHFSKGCYLGQEIVERVRSRAQVHRHLTGLALDATTAPPAGTVLMSGDVKAGEITSAAYSPHHERVFALGYLRTDKEQPGTVLDASGTRAEVLGPPK